MDRRKVCGLLFAVVSLAEGRRLASERVEEDPTSLKKLAALIAEEEPSAFIPGASPIRQAPRTLSHGDAQMRRDVEPTMVDAAAAGDLAAAAGTVAASGDFAAWWASQSEAAQAGIVGVPLALAALGAAAANRDDEDPADAAARKEGKALAAKEAEEEKKKAEVQPIYDKKQEAMKSVTTFKAQLTEAVSKKEDLQKQIVEQGEAVAKLEAEAASAASKVADLTKELEDKLTETGLKMEEFVKQDFLEFSPYYDKATMPNNVFKPKDPFTATIRSVKKIVGEGATGETCDIVIDHGGDMPYIEGQSYGVVPPGVDAKGKPNKVRLYSIASSRYGDDMTGKTTTLCVRRATYWCPELKADDPAKKGVCSNYLCDAKAGDVVKLTGPTGKVMLLPEEKPDTDIIMVATGTGIAPMRSFLRRMFAEKTPYAKDFKGLAWLFLGVANSDALLYDDEWKEIQKNNPKTFRYDVALSREQTKKDGGKMYIQDRVEEYGDEIFKRLDEGAHIYFCGLKGMMPGIQDMLKRVAESKKLDYDEFIKKLKKNGQWHVEVY